MSILFIYFTFLHIFDLIIYFKHFSFHFSLFVYYFPTFLSLIFHIFYFGHIFTLSSIDFILSNIYIFKYICKYLIYKNLTYCDDEMSPKKYQSPSSNT